MKVVLSKQEAIKILTDYVTDAVLENGETVVLYNDYDIVENELTFIVSTEEE